MFIYCRFQLLLTYLYEQRTYVSERRTYVKHVGAGLRQGVQVEMHSPMLIILEKISSTISKSPNP